MAIDSKYGNITVEKEPGNPLNDTDEPVILFRARDDLALDVISDYKAISREADISQEFLDFLSAVEGSFRRWRTANPELVKLPD